VVRLTARIDLGKDLGQNFGTLFEARNGHGRLVFGAGFPGAYNTRYRMDRFAVQFFIRPGGDAARPVMKTLPRPSLDAGTYIFNLDGRLYSFAEGQDRQLRVWNETRQNWGPEPEPLPHRMRIGRGFFIFTDQGAEYDGKSVLSKPAEGQYHNFYYAGGRLFFYHTHRVGEGGYTRIYACPWQLADRRAANLEHAIALSTQIPGEVSFCWGQLGPKVLTVSNYGGIYVFDGKAWSVLREPLKGVSYQVYSALNYYDSLLLGQYPTGELFEYNGRQLRHLKGWPPRIAGVSSNAREAQTMAIYGGDLFVGVWPWGELWRYDRDEQRWTSMGRMFTHPSVTDRVTHPYEKETIAAGAEVLNQWGQRITSMVPLGDSLFVSTSAKWHCQWEPKFDFLANDKWKEYGQVWRLAIPGNLSASIAWKDGPTELQFLIARDEMMIVQDGKQLAAAPISTALTAALESAKVTWGRGVFGPFAGSSSACSRGTRNPRRRRRSPRPRATKSSQEGPRRASPGSERAGRSR
jgi:hypothetical protein